MVGRGGGGKERRDGGERGGRKEGGERQRDSNEGEYGKAVHTTPHTDSLVSIPR